MRSLARLSTCMLAASLTITFAGGCTQEKAEALLTTAEVFRTEANNTIAAYESLIQAGLGDPAPLSESDAIDRIINTANLAYDANGELTFEQVTEGLNDPFEDAREQARAFTAQQQLLYNAFSDSLTNLPRGSFFAAEEVACTSEIARRLVVKIARYGEAIETLEVSLVAPEEIAEIALEDALASGSEVEIREAAREVYELHQTRQELNEAVISQSVIAAQAGIRVIEAAENYDNFSAEDILQLAREALTIAGTLEGVDVQVALSTLDQLRQQAEGDEAWQTVLDRDLFDMGTRCSQQ